MCEKGGGERDVRGCEGDADGAAGGAWGVVGREGQEAGRQGVGGIWVCGLMGWGSLCYLGAVDVVREMMQERRF